MPENPKLIEGGLAAPQGRYRRQTFASFRSSRCLSYTSAEMGRAGSFLRTNERPCASYCDHPVLVIRRYFHFWPHSCSLGIREAIEVSAMKQTEVLSMTDHLCGWVRGIADCQTRTMGLARKWGNSYEHNNINHHL